MALYMYVYIIHMHVAKYIAFMAVNLSYNWKLYYDTDLNPNV